MSSADLTLSAAELSQLTGYEPNQTTRMVRWLEARGWIFEKPTRRGDIPKVDREYYRAKMSGQAPTQLRRKGPNLAFMTGAKAA